MLTVSIMDAYKFGRIFQNLACILLLVTKAVTVQYFYALYWQNATQKINKWDKEFMNMSELLSVWILWKNSMTYGKILNQSFPKTRSRMLYKWFQRILNKKYVCVCGWGANGNKKTGVRLQVDTKIMLILVQYTTSELRIDKRMGLGIWIHLRDS